MSMSSATTAWPSSGSRLFAWRAVRDRSAELRDIERIVSNNSALLLEAWNEYFSN